MVTINRPERRNAVDGSTARLLFEAFEAFDRDERPRVAVLTGAGGTFCAGADLKAFSEGEPRPIRQEGRGPMGPTRLVTSKPVLAAVEGYAVAGGLELAIWCDLRVMAADAVFGVFCRRFGVPLVDGGTVRLPRLIGQSQALDMVLTGREVGPKKPCAWVWPTVWSPPGRPSRPPSPWPKSWPPSPRPVSATTGCRSSASGACPSTTP